MFHAGAQIRFRRARHLRREQYPLPPREITEALAERAGAKAVEEGVLTSASLVSDFGFGAVAGGFYGLFVSSQGRQPMGAGIGFGLMVWATSYHLGWLPASGIFQSATRHPLRRNALMIAAHLVWGSTLGVVVKQLAQALPPFSGGELKDR